MMKVFVIICQVWICTSTWLPSLILQAYNDCESAGNGCSVRSAVIGAADVQIDAIFKN